MGNAEIAIKIQDIIAARQKLLPLIQSEQKAWQQAEQRLGEVQTAATRLAEAKNSTQELRESLRQLESLSSKPREALIALDRVFKRYNRNTINIGIGGAARMGKSTLLQSITGLGDMQIPTSEFYFTTAIRSQIINSENGRATADMHDEDSFLREVIVPLCKNARISEPFSLSAFLSMTIEPNPKESRSQEIDDIIKRLKDAQAALPTFRRELTGECGRSIPLPELRPYVAYPEGGASKGGPFLAVKNLVIYAPFPQNDVRQLQVIDLPGLGEGGIDLGKLQTKGLADTCDLTVFLKRPTDTSVAWNSIDTNALDAIRNSLESITDQTKFTVILANIDDLAQERADKCFDAIKAEITRDFKIMRCNAKDASKVRNETMTMLLDHLIKHLPEMDATLLKNARHEVTVTRQALQQELEAIMQVVKKMIPVSSSTGQAVRYLAMELRNKIAEALETHCDKLDSKAAHHDDEWGKAVDDAHARVKRWIEEGAGYGSKDEFLKSTRDCIRINKGQPNAIINAVRIGFREQWDIVDDHLRERIAATLDEILDIMKKHTGDFIPEKPQLAGWDDAKSRLNASRQQILMVADKFSNEAESLDDRLECPGIAACCRRLAEVDLTFRFHLEPMLHAATTLLHANDLPRVSETNEAEIFTKGLSDVAKRASDEYAKALRGGNASTAGRTNERLDRLLRSAGFSEDIMAKFHEICAPATDNAFRPSRIISAVAGSFYDAIIRARNAEKEYFDWAESWRDEIWPDKFNQESDSALVKNLRDAVQTMRKALQEI